MGTPKMDVILEQPAATNPIGSFLVFLHLLKCYVDLSAKLRLRHPTILAKNPNVLADQRVDSVLASAAHRLLLPKFCFCKRLQVLLSENFTR